MTFTGQLIVNEVSRMPGRTIDIVAIAHIDETYPAVMPDGMKKQVPRITTSGSEGDIVAIEVRVSLSDRQTEVKPGDRIGVSGHFQGLRV